MSPSQLAAHEKREFASEIKFLLDPATATAVRDWARARMVADPNAQGFAGDTYAVTSLYFDTPSLDVFHRQGLHRHSKFRIRRYGDGSFFFERKLKIRGRLAKRRTPVTPAEVVQLAAGLRPDSPGLWFEQKLFARRLQPQCQIKYQRTARVLMSASGPIRLTLDDSICGQPASDIRFDDTRPTVPVTDRVILELKFRRDLPVLFRELLSTFALNPVSFSKYRAALPLIGLVPAASGAPVEAKKIS
ncbi:MAG: polyphosphate polymerase domain-containing protein [Opitutaceae bacterium]